MRSRRLAPRAARPWERRARPHGGVRLASRRVAGKVRRRRGAARERVRADARVSLAERRDALGAVVQQDAAQLPPPVRFLPSPKLPRRVQLDARLKRAGGLL